MAVPHHSSSGAETVPSPPKLGSRLPSGRNRANAAHGRCPHQGARTCRRWCRRRRSCHPRRLRPLERHRHGRRCPRVVLSVAAEARIEVPVGVVAGHTEQRAAAALRASDSDDRSTRPGCHGCNPLVAPPRVDRHARRTGPDVGDRNRHRGGCGAALAVAGRVRERVGADEVDLGFVHDRVPRDCRGPMRRWPPRSPAATASPSGSPSLARTSTATGGLFDRDCGVALRDGGAFGCQEGSLSGPAVVSCVSPLPSAFITQMSEVAAPDGRPVNAMRSAVGRPSRLESVALTGSESRLPAAVRGHHPDVGAEKAVHRGAVPGGRRYASRRATRRG